MILPRLTPVNVLEVWKPRYHDKVFLLAKYKVLGPHNQITFTQDKRYPETYYLSTETIKKYPVETNGTIPCYAVKLSELSELLERV